MQLVPTAGFNSIIAAAFLLTGVGMVGAYGILLRSKRLLQLYCLTWVLCIIMQTVAGVATLAWLEQENNLANKLTTNGIQPLNVCRSPLSVHTPHAWFCTPSSATQRP